MKQKIYIAGLITALIIITGTIMKVNHLPGAGYTLVTGTLGLIFIFLPAALLNHYRHEGERRNKLLYILSWVTCLVVFGAMLFKVMHWPFAGIALMIALPFPYVVFLPVYLAVTGGKSNLNIHNTIYVLFLLAGISVFSLLLALNVSKDKLEYAMDLARNYNRVEKMADRLLTVRAPAVADNQADELITVVDACQAFIFKNEGMTEAQWENDPWLLSRPEYNDIKLPSTAGGNAASPGSQLEQDLRKYISSSAEGSGDGILAGEAPVIFVMPDTQGEPYEWSRMMFLESPRIWSLVYLDALETNLKLIRAGN
jgi:hypothetical protein